VLLARGYPVSGRGIIKSIEFFFFWCFRDMLNIIVFNSPFFYFPGIISSSITLPPLLLLQQPTEELTDLSPMAIDLPGVNDKLSTDLAEIIGTLAVMTIKEPRHFDREKHSHDIMTLQLLITHSVATEPFRSACFHYPLGETTGIAFTGVGVRNQ